MADASKKSKKILTNPLSGFMELLPAEQILFNSMAQTIQKNYELYGFSPLDTPVLERAEVLLAKAGGDTEKQIYRFTKGDTDLAMRFDQTVPLARFVANNYSKLTFPYRRYVIAKSYRGERPQAGRFREFYQADIDVIGDTDLSLQYDGELPSIIYSVFTELGFDRFTIFINNRKIIQGVFEALGVMDQSKPITQSIDRLDKIGTKGVKTQLEDMALTKEVIDALFSFVSIKGTSDDMLTQLENMPVNSELLSEGIEDLRTVLAIIRKLGVPEEFFQVNFSIARGLDYYTGTVYETRLDDCPEIGTICAGGRYEDLASSYTERKLPGVGMSIGLTRLFDQLLLRGLIKSGSSSTSKVLIVPLMDNLAKSLEIASALRKAGISTEVSYVQGKMDKKLKYATKLGIPYALFVGEDEVANGLYGLKDLEKRSQTELTLEGIVEALQKEKA